MQKTPKPVVKRSYLNLDAIFGHVYSNLTGTPLTPSRIASFYLIRILFETHFGRRHRRSKHPFSTEEKAIVSQTLYGLLTMEEEMTYEDYRRLVRMAFGWNRNIAINFYAAMEQIAAGEANVNLAIEDEFYTNKHPRNPNIPRGDPYHYAAIYAARFDLPFSSSHSFIYRWIKSILAQYAKTSSSEMFKINTVMRRWILTGDKRFRLIPPHMDIPEYVDNSMRARDWTSKVFYFLDKAPQLGFTHESMLQFTELVQKLHPDITDTWLLQAVTFVELKDCSLAIKAIKAFFDYSMFELNENMVHASRTHRLAVPSSTPLMYAPILHARIARLFGDLETARLLLHEGLQQAQLRSDEVCHQMANLEMHTVDIIGGYALLENRTIKLAEPYLELDRRVQRKALRNIDDLHGHSRSGPCCLSSEEDFELCAEMDSLGKMVMILKTIAEGQYKLHYDRIAETGLSCPLGNDHKQRGMKVTGYGHAIITSNMIHNGMYRQAQSAAEQMLRYNFKFWKQDTWCIEPWAVGMTNLAYSFAGLGDYAKAVQVIGRMREKLNKKVYWQSWRHVVIASSCVNFERFFLRNDYKKADAELPALLTYSHLEHKLRRSLILCVSGKSTQAIQTLKEMKCADTRGNIRIHMQLASIFTATRHYDQTKMEIGRAMGLAIGTTLKDVRAMIRRREATMLMCTGKYEKAITILRDIYDDMEKYGSFTERLCYYMTAARCFRMHKLDPRNWLRHLRTMIRGKQWPTMEKLILTEIAAFHEPDGMMPNEDRLYQVREQFGKMHADFPGRCEWLLI